MKKIVSVAVCFLIVLLFPLSATGQKETITVIYDINPYRESLNASWGFSCLIKGLEKTILFDTGGSGTILLANMTKLGINPRDIDLVVLSYHSILHMGGLFDFLDMNHDVRVYLTKTFFLPGFKNTVRKYGAEVVEVQGAVKICDRVYSSGELGETIIEQALFIQTEKGLIVITACSRPGIVKIVQKAKDVLKDEVLLVMGGFCLDDTNEETLGQIVSDFKRLGVRYVGPCNCSGDNARSAFQKEYQNHFFPLGVGATIDIKELQ